MVGNQNVQKGVDEKRVVVRSVVAVEKQKNESRNEQIFCGKKSQNLPRFGVVYGLRYELGKGMRGFWLRGWLMCLFGMSGVIL